MGRSSGWWEAFAYVWVIAVLNLTYAAGITLGVHPTAFLLEAFIVGGIALLLIAKPGRNALAIVRTPQTWAYGATVILGEIFYYAMNGFVAPTDANVFLRLTIPMTILIGWLVLGRHVGRLRVIGIAIVLAAVLLAFYAFPAAQSLPFVSVTLAASLAMSSRNFFAEFHPWNRQARNVIEKIRVTGLVVLATAIAGLLTVLILSLAAAQGLLPSTRALPALAEFWRPATLVLALIMGGVVITAMQYLMFSSVVKITSENFFAIMALTPLSTLILQEIAARLGVIGAKPGGWYILPYILLILTGNVLIIWSMRQGAAAAPAPRNA